MATASNAKTKLGIVKEVVFGTTPASPVFAQQKHSSESLNMTINEVLDESKSDTRQYNYTMQGTRSVQGSIDGPLDHDNYGVLLESALFSEWASDNTLSLGEDRVSVSIEKSTDNGAYFLYKGVVVNSFSINSTASDAATTVTFDVMGISADDGTVSASASPYTPIVNTLPFTSCGGVLLEGGAPLAQVSSIALTVDNGITAEYYWGNCDIGDLVTGRAEVTGTLEVFFNDLVLYNKFKNGTATSLEFTLTNGAAGGNQTYTFSLPNIRYTASDLPSSAGSESMIISLTFRALYDLANNESGLKITRSA